MVELSESQKDAVHKATSFVNDSDDEIFRLFGAAGVGKSTIIAWLLEEFPEAHLCALSGKAVDVLRTKGMDRAQTLHSLLYKPILPDSERVDDLAHQLRQTSDGQRQAKLRADLSRLTELRWSLSDKAQKIAESDEQQVVILDEASMVGATLFQQLLDLGVKVIAVGDPFQLPPVKDSPFLTTKNPDVLLTEIHRQAEQSGVLRLATEIREGETPQFRKENDCCVTNDISIAQGKVLAQFGQTIVGTHNNRRRLNRLIRDHRGFGGALPQVDEPLICTKNKDVVRSGNETPIRVYNGQNLKVVSPPETVSGSVSARMTLAKAADPEEQFDVDVYDGAFLDHYDYDQDRHYRDYKTRKDLFEADFAHAVTAHKAQGSEFPDVFVYHDGFGKDADTKRQWLYTAVTRAQDGVVLYSPFLG